MSDSEQASLKIEIFRALVRQDLPLPEAIRRYRQFSDAGKVQILAEVLGLA